MCKLPLFHDGEKDFKRPEAIIAASYDPFPKLGTRFRTAWNAEINKLQESSIDSHKKSSSIRTALLRQTTIHEGGK
jgi:hypothetical protein